MMYEATIHAPDRTVSVEQNTDYPNTRDLRCEADICSIEWVKMYHWFRKEELLNSAGWIEREYFAIRIATYYALPDFVAWICVDLTVDNDILAINRDRQREPWVKPWEVEKIELKIRAEIQITYLGDYTEN